MYLMIVSTADVGDSHDSKELEVERLAFDQTKPATMSETVRAKYNLSAAHRAKIEEWLSAAKAGDTLLLNVKERRVGGKPSDLMTDDVALIVAPYTPVPVVSRLVLKEVTTIEAALQSLPANARKVTRASKKSKKK